MDARYKTRTKRLKLENILNDDPNREDTINDNDPIEGERREREIDSWRQAFDLATCDHEVYQAEIQTLISTSITMKTSLAAGILENNALYLTPITDVMQMRPSFKHLKVVEKDDKDDHDDQSSNRYYSSKAKKSIETVMVKRQDMNRSSNPRLQYFSNLLTDEENEAWTDLNLLKECTNVRNLKSYVEKGVDLQHSSDSSNSSVNHAFKPKSKPKGKKDFK